MRILIKNGYVVDPKSGTDGKFDVLVEKGRIISVSNEIDANEPAIREIIDAAGMYVFPGLVDPHCHLRDPGYEYKEDIESGTKSAVMGGFTSVACMPNTNPVTDSASVISYIYEKTRRDGVCKVYPIGAITKGQKGEELAEMGEMKFAGAVAVSDDGKPVVSGSLMRKAMQYAAIFEIPVISHCEDLDIADGGVMNEGYWSSVLGLKGIPSAAEDTMVSRELILSRYLDLPIHIAHVSTALSVEMIRSAKKSGVKVTCETCPHYFTLTDEACDGFNTNAKVNPPLRTQKDVKAIIKGLQDGTIDMIATDHAPHHTDEKNIEFDVAANGLVGFETAFALGVTYLVKPGYITLSKLIEKMSLVPAQFLAIQGGSIGVGSAADIFTADIDTCFKVDSSTFKSKGKNTPFNGFELYGKVCYTLVDGEIIVDEGVLIKE